MPTLNEMDFETTRGPLVRGDGSSAPTIGSPVKYTMTADISFHCPTNGSPRTAENVCRVRATDADAFMAAILPDVYEDTWNPNSDSDFALKMSAYEANRAYPSVTIASPITFARNKLVRLAPQRHPKKRLYAVDAIVIRGNGFPSQLEETGGAQSLTFRRKPFHKHADGGDVDPVDGFVDIKVMWQDLPYTVEIPVPAPGDSNTEINDHSEGSELLRYCIFKPHPKGRNLQIAGGVAWFVNDDGTIAKSPNNVPLPVPDQAHPMFVPSGVFSVTLKMVPRVPIGAYLLWGMVNQFQGIRFPASVFKDKPDVGTLLYTGFELSDPYYTVTDQQVFDVTYNFGYQPGGTLQNHGWNSAYCSGLRDFRRIVFGFTDGTNIAAADGRVLKPASTPDWPYLLPVTDASKQDQSPRLTIAGANTYDFGDIENLFRFEGPRIFGEGEIAAGLS